MVSISTLKNDGDGTNDRNELKRLFFRDRDGKRHHVRLGKITKKSGEQIKLYVSKLVSAQIRNVSPDDDAAFWLNGLPDDFYARLARTGLVAPRKKVGTLGEMIPAVIVDKSVDAKPATVEIFRQAERCLYKHFGTDRKVDSITESNVKEFKVWLEKHGSLKKSTPLKPTTVSKRLQHVSSFFHRLKESGIIPCNPFKRYAKKAPVDETRNRYIDEETILTVMEYAPDAEWRLIIALWRFAGLRAVSEVLMLRWEDILWDQKEMMVRSPKTEHCGKGLRKIPLFPHIEECLTEAFEQAPEGSIYVVEKHAPVYLRGQKERIYISRQGNIGTQFRKIILRAGIEPWGKLIQNLRASLEIDLLSKKYGDYNIYVIAKWLGHSVKVMLEHYGRFQQSDFAQIAEACEQVKQKKGKTAQKVAHISPVSMQDDEVFTGIHSLKLSEGVAQKAAQHVAAEGEFGGNGEESPFLLMPIMH